MARKEYSSRYSTDNLPPLLYTYSMLKTRIGTSLQNWTVISKEHPASGGGGVSRTRFNFCDG